MRTKSTGEAEQNLKKAQKILHEQGYPKLVKEIKTMLLHLKEMNEEGGAVSQLKEK
jgi:hypothetical protein